MTKRDELGKLKADNDRLQRQLITYRSLLSACASQMELAFSAARNSPIRATTEEWFEWSDFRHVLDRANKFLAPETKDENDGSK